MLLTSAINGFNDELQAWYEQQASKDDTAGSLMIRRYVDIMRCAVTSLFSTQKFSLQFAISYLAQLKTEFPYYIPYTLHWVYNSESDLFHLEAHQASYELCELLLKFLNKLLSSPVEYPYPSNYYGLTLTYVQYAIDSLAQVALNLHQQIHLYKVFLARKRSLGFGLLLSTIHLPYIPTLEDDKAYVGYVLESIGSQSVGHRNKTCIPSAIYPQFLERPEAVERTSYNIKISHWIQQFILTYFNETQKLKFNGQADLNRGRFLVNCDHVSKEIIVIVVLLELPKTDRKQQNHVRYCLERIIKSLQRMAPMTQNCDDLISFCSHNLPHLFAESVPLEPEESDSAIDMSTP